MKTNMSTNIQQLSQEVNDGGNCVNLGRSLEKRNFELYKWILDTTEFLNVKQKVKFNERVYCILNNITSLQLNAFGKLAVFDNLFLGYSFCEYTKNKIDNKKVKIKKTKPIPLSKFEKFLQSTRKRNSRLYEPGLIENVDYVVCPVSLLRMDMIKDSYIEKILKINPQDYWKKYPNQKKNSDRRIQNIKNSLKKINPETGLTVHQSAMVKATVTKNTPDENGITPNQRIGKNTKAAHMRNIDEFGRNGYKRQAYNRLTTVLPNGLTVEQNAHIKQRETLLNNQIPSIHRASKISKKVLKPILEYLDINNIKYYFDINEYSIKDTETGNFYLSPGKTVIL
jgi:hypothetical protein